MKTPASLIISKAQVSLQDDGTRWPAAELVLYLNEAQRVLLNSHPEENAVSMTFTPVEGGRQTMPSDAMLLLEVRCNTNDKMRAVTRVERATLESVARDWASETPKAVVSHFMYSQAEPRVFYLYPPASTDARLELTYCKYPDDIPIPVGPAGATVMGDTTLEHKWEHALLAYVLYRAWMKDAEAAGNGQIAAGYMAAFTSAIGAVAAKQ